MGTLKSEDFAYDETKERFAPHERNEWLNSRLADVVEYAYHNAKQVGRAFDKLGLKPNDIRTIKDLEKIPVTTKDELLQLQHREPPFGGFLTVPLNSLKRIYISPGPLYDVVGGMSQALLRFFKATKLARPGDIVMVAMNFHMVPAGLELADALNLAGVTVVPTGTGQAELQVRIAHDLEATGFCGFPDFLMNVLSKAEEMNCELSFKWALGGGRLSRQLEQKGLDVFEFYGTADAGLLAWECSEKCGMHYNDEDAIIEIVDPKTGKQLPPGEEGEVVVTVLNKIYPLIRLGTSDLASYVNERCRCGRTSPRIPRITGMLGDHVRVKSMFVHGAELEKALSVFPAVSRYQMVLSQEGYTDRICLKLEPNQPVDKKALAANVKIRCKEVFRLNVDKIEFVLPGFLQEGSPKFIDRRFK